MRWHLCGWNEWIKRFNQFYNLRQTRIPTFITTITIDIDCKWELNRCLIHLPNDIMSCMRMRMYNVKLETDHLRKSFCRVNRHKYVLRIKGVCLSNQIKWNIENALQRRMYLKVRFTMSFLVILCIVENLRWFCLLVIFIFIWTKINFLNIHWVESFLFSFVWCG